VTLIDVNLGSESGFELAEQLHRSGLSTPSPVILTSTHAEQDFADMIATSPAIGFLAKFALTADAIRNLVGGADGPRLRRSAVNHIARQRNLIHPLPPAVTAARTAPTPATAASRYVRCDVSGAPK
jgi:hypothetical protein